MFIKAYVNEGAKKHDLICITECRSCKKDIEIKYYSLVKIGGQTFCRSCTNRTRKLKKEAVTKHPAFTRLKDMKARCYNKNNKRYSSYGGRGITICEEWMNDTKSFLDWADNKGFENGLSIDRIDNEGNYDPDNCRWATNSQQQQNKGLARNNTSGYKGVSQVRSGKYQANLNNKGVYYYIGTFKTKIEAVEAYNEYIKINELGHTLNDLV